MKKTLASRVSKKNILWLVALAAVIVVVAVVLLGREPSVDDQQRYLVAVRNVGNEPLAPGVFVVHRPAVSFDFLGKRSPDAFEPLAEWGDPAPFAQTLQDQSKIINVITETQPLAPGAVQQFGITAPGDNYVLSGMRMIATSNDGYAFVEVPLEEIVATKQSQTFDSGTEENTAIGSGFAGGQPDPARGEDNAENGTPTNPIKRVAIHPDLTEAALEVTVTPLID